MIRSPDLLKTLIGMTFSLSPKTPEILRPRWHLQTPIYYQFLRGSGNKSQPIQSTLTAFGNPSGNRLHPLTHWSCTTVFLYGYHMTQSRGSDLPGPSHYAQNGCPRRTEPALSGGIARRSFSGGIAFHYSACHSTAVWCGEYHGLAVTRPAECPPRTRTTLISPGNRSK